MDERKIMVAVVQMNTIPGTMDPKDQLTAKEKKVEHALELITEAGKEGAKIILLGELFNVDYDIFYYPRDPRLCDLAETIPGPTTEAIGALTKKYCNYVIAPMFETAMPGAYYNSAPIIGPKGNVVGNYRKTHLGGTRCMEPMWFRRGESFQVYTTDFEPYARFSTIICADRRYPETARIIALEGAEILTIPLAAPGYAAGAVGSVRHEGTNISRAVDNMMFVLVSNRIGKEIEHDYMGGSMIISPQGRVLVRAEDKETILYETLDLEEVQRERVAWPMFRDLKPDLYIHYWKRAARDKFEQASQTNP